MVAVASVFRGALDGKHDLDDANARLADLLPEVAFAGGFLDGQPGRLRSHFLAAS